MKLLRTLLILIYPFLIILLLLLNLDSCRNHAGEREGRTDEDVDTTDVVRQAQNIGEDGDLKITLLWDFYADIDLHVIEPNGNHIYFENKVDSSTDGYLDVDNTCGGSGSAENVYWKNPPSGKYYVSLVYYQASTNNGKIESGNCTVVVFQQGKDPKTYDVQMSNIGDKENVATIEIE